MHTRGSAGRFLLVVGLGLGAVLALVGGLALPAAGLVAVALVSATVGCLAGGNLQDRRGSQRARSGMDSAAIAAGGTFGIVLVFAGLVVLTGGPIAVLIATAAVAVTLAVLMRRNAGASRGAPRRGAAPDSGGLLPVLRPVATLSAEALRREWLLSTSALGVLVDTGTREAIVRRRQDLLDEMERRDPAGFARWLAAGPAPGSAPARQLGSDPAADKDAA